MRTARSFTAERQQLWTKGRDAGHISTWFRSAPMRRRQHPGADRPCRPDLQHGRRVVLCRGAPHGGEQLAFLSQLEATIAKRIVEQPRTATRRASTAQGPGPFAQNPARKGVELALAAVSRDDDAVWRKAPTSFTPAAVAQGARPVGRAGGRRTRVAAPLQPRLRVSRAPRS